MVLSELFFSQNGNSLLSHQYNDGSLFPFKTLLLIKKKKTKQKTNNSTVAAVKAVGDVCLVWELHFRLCRI